MRSYQARVDGPFEVLAKINDTTGTIDLPREYRVSCIFNVTDLKPYCCDDLFKNVRPNSLQQGKDDAPIRDHHKGHVRKLPK